MYLHNLFQPPPLPKRGRSSEDFLTFCKMILDYENYDGELVRHRHTSSPLGSTGDSSLSSFHDETYQETLTVTGEPGDMWLTCRGRRDLLGWLSNANLLHNSILNSICLDDFEDEDEEITCYCRKPYGGRPMIECSSCQTWVHLTCAKVKRNNIPDTWYCKYCQAKSTKGGARSRGRKTQLRTKQQNPLAVLTKSKRRLWAESHDPPTLPPPPHLDLWRVKLQLVSVQ